VSTLENDGSGKILAVELNEGAGRVFLRLVDSAFRTVFLGVGQQHRELIVAVARHQIIAAKLRHDLARVGVQDGRRRPHNHNAR